MLDDLIKERVDKEKPRKEGLTYIIDKLQGIDKENFKIISPLIDIVKIYGAFPLLVPDTILKEKIVSTIRSQGLRYHWKIGKKDPRHQLSIDKTLEKIEEVTKVDKKIGGGGRDNGNGGHATYSNRNGTENTITEKIIFEANEGIGVGIYDEKGAVKWGFVGAITSKYPPNRFIF